MSLGTGVQETENGSLGENNQYIRDDGWGSGGGKFKSLWSRDWSFVYYLVEDSPCAEINPTSAALRRI